MSSEEFPSYVANSNSQMVELLRKNGKLRSCRVTEAMEAVDRGYFLSHGQYYNCDMDIGYGQKLLSPETIASLLEVAKSYLRVGGQVLDVGCGAGYMAAIFTQLVGRLGRVTALEKKPELAAQATANIRKALPSLIEQGRIEVIGENAKQRYRDNAPYNLILIESFDDLSIDFFDLMNEWNGALIAPVDNGAYYQLSVRKFNKLSNQMITPFKTDEMDQKEATT